MQANDFLRESAKPPTSDPPKTVSRARRETVILKAETEGLKVVYGGEGVLLVDIDAGVTELTASLETLAAFRGPLKIREVWRTKSRNGNDHLYVRTDLKLSRAERLLLQGVLGDPKRAILDWFWAREQGAEGGVDECFLFETKDARPERVKLADYDGEGNYL